MKATFALFSFLTLLCLSGATGQEINQSLAPEGLLSGAHQEKIFVHHNSSVIFPGEYFLYSVYNLNSSSGKLSNLSKVAYVELLGENGNVVFRQKVELDGGIGSADYFIPTSVPSGNYKLLAYTNWMRNIENNFFESDVTLINPYQSNQKELLENTTGSIAEAGKTISNYSNRNSAVDISINKNSFENRDRVEVSLVAKTSGSQNGNYSLSVRKSESLPFAHTNTAVSKITQSEQGQTSRNSEIVILPELRGQLISGKILSEGTGSPENKAVALSIPSTKSFSQIASTNKQGQFFFNLEPDIRNENAVLEVLNNGSNNFRIELDDNNGVASTSLNFSEFKLTPEMKEIILQRSIYNQIENAFFEVKPDTLAPAEDDLPLPQRIVENYMLDEYTRFKTIPETFVEIIKSAWVRKNSAGEPVFQVRGLMNYTEMGLLPLVMIDGILVRDHAIAANIDADKIRAVRIIRDKIFLGPSSFQGAVLFETINGDFFELYNAPNIKKVALFNPEIPKNYFQQVYSPENKDNRIPDFRYQLLWKPSIKLKEAEETLEFFTSDVDGDYEVVLEGFTADGTPVSVRETFKVE